MAVFKCKMCGGDLEILENATVCECEYCGTKQTVPRLDTEKKLALFSRANNLRLKSEFDKASGIYESIITEFRDEAEAYWGLVLCKYGIEYVEDGNGRRIPTCHRTLPVSVMDDDDFEQACEYADATAKTVYRNEAKAIDKIQKKILKIAHSEEPYDIFICYKETDDSTGARTEDSLIAQDIYTRLIKDDYRVFFARDSLREVAGVDYEPYIYAALSSAKIMLAIGTKYEYYDAVWVKNEWSRFISMMGDDSKKVLIPCFKNMDAYDMPKEFKNMQALDMGEVTFFGDLSDNIERIVGKKEKATSETIVLNSENTDFKPLLERGFLFLEDEKWQKADDFFEAVLNKDAKNAEAYLGKLLVDLEVSTVEELQDFYTPFDDNDNYEKIMRFGKKALKEKVKSFNDLIIRRNEENRKRDMYEKALAMMKGEATESELLSAGYLLLEVADFNDAKDKAEECFARAEVVRAEAEEAEKSRIYTSACAVLDENREWFGTEKEFSEFEEAIKALSGLEGWRDSNEKLLLCQQKLLKLKQDAEKARQEEEEQKKREELVRQEAIRREKKKKKIISVSAVSAVAVILALVFVINNVILPKIKFSDIVAISAGNDHTVALKSDGAVVAVGSNGRGQSDVSDWKDIISISASGRHTVGLKSDGTVVAVGENDCGQCNVSDWTDIVAISAGNSHTVGLKSDGTVVATGFLGGNKHIYGGECDVSGWTDIVAISAGTFHTVGLKSDGTVVATEYTENDYYEYDGQCDVSGWTDIVAISAGSSHTVGLKSDGTVVAVGDNNDGQCDVSGWTDIIAISAGDYHTVGLKSDGTVVATEYVGDYYHGQCDVSGWADIIAISAGDFHTVGLKSDGTVVAVGENNEGQCNVG